MKPLLLLVWVIAFTFPLSISAQKRNNMYVALKSGLSIRDNPDDKAKVIGKIPYGTKLSVEADATTSIRIITEGFYGYWTKVTYNTITGYVVNSYLLSVPPPKAGITTMKNYLLQLSPVFSAPLTIKNGDINTIDGGGLQLKKQLYKNGVLLNEYSGYEYSAEVSFMPNLTVAEAFLLVRLLSEFNTAIAPTDPFPTANKIYKRESADYDLKVEKEMIGTDPWIKKIHIEFSDGSMNTLEIYEVESEVVISYSSGV